MNFKWARLENFRLRSGLTLCWSKIDTPDNFYSGAAAHAHQKKFIRAETRCSNFRNFQSFSKLSDSEVPFEEVKRSKYSLSICWQSSIKFLCCRTMLAKRVSGSGVVKILNRCPKTIASNSVGLKYK